MGSPLAAVRSLFAALTTAILLSACGGTKPPPAAPPTAPAVAAPAASAVAAPPDLSEVPEPPGIVALLRVRNLQSLTDTVQSWTGIPIGARDFIGQIHRALLPAVLALDAPIDIVVALDPSAQSLTAAPLAAVSFPVRSLDEAKDEARALGKVRELRPGVFRMSTTSSDFECLLAAAAGAPAARLVCGPSQADLDALFPFAVRTLPRRDLGPADLHAEIHLAPVDAKYGPLARQSMSLAMATLAQQVETGDRDVDRTSMIAGGALAEELGLLLSDADTVSFDLTLHEKEATFESRLHLRDGQSWTVQTLRDASQRVAPPPPSFFRLPGDATLAEFIQPSGAPARFEPLRRTLGTLLLGWLSHDGVPKADRTAVAELFAAPLVLEAPYVFAHGPLADTGSGAPSSMPTWMVTGIGGPSEPAVALMRKFVGIWNRAAIQRWTRKVLTSLESSAGSSLAGAGTGLTSSWRTTPAPKQLPKGTLAYVSTWVPLESSGAAHSAPASPADKGDDRSKSGAGAKSKAPSKPLSVYLFVVPAGDATWIGSGTDTSAITARLQALLEPAPLGPPALLAQPEVAGAANALKTQPSLSGGFWTLRGLFDQVRASQLGSKDGSLGGVLDRLASLPHRAETPMVFDLHPLDSSTGTVSLEFHLPKAAIEDLTAIGLRALAAPALGKGSGFPSMGPANQKHAPMP